MWGGIEPNETNELALQRECVEEIGCSVEIKEEVGYTIEYRKQFNLKQISYCYIAKVVGEKGNPKLEPDEIAEGFETVWLTLDEAIKRVSESKPTIYEGPYMVTRDFALLQKAKKLAE